jgi:hypothetical protein
MPTLNKLLFKGYNILSEDICGSHSIIMYIHGWGTQTLLQNAS